MKKNGSENLENLKYTNLKIDGKNHEKNTENI